MRKRVRSCFFLILLIFLPFLAYPLSFNWTGGASTNSWIDGLNWNQGGLVPGAGDDVTIGANPFNNVSMDSLADPGIQSLTISGAGASLTLTRSMTITGPCVLGGAAVGALDVGAQTLAVNGNLTLNTNGSFTITSGTLQVNGTSTLNTGISAIGAGTIQLVSAVSVGASITLSTGGGTIALGNTVTGTGAENLTLSTGAGSITLSGAISSLTDLSISTNAGGINLPQTSISGNLSITASGPITDSGTLTVPGTASLTPGAGNSVTLNTAANNFGTVTVTNGADATIVDSNAINLGPINITGNLGVTATAGNITNTGGALTIGTASTFTANAAGASITVNNAGNNFTGAVSFAGSGGLSDVTVLDTTSLDLQALSISGNLTVTAAGITDSGALSITGTTTLTAGALNNITLNNANDFVGAVSIVSGNNVTLNDLNTFDLTTATINGSLSLSCGTQINLLGNVTALQSLTILSGTLNTNNFNLTVGLNLTGAGALSALAGGAQDIITVGGNFSPTNFNANGCSVVFNTANAANVGSYTFFDVTINKGAPVPVNATGAWTVTNTLTINAANEILNMAGNNFTFATLVNNGTLELYGTQAVQTITTMDIDSGTVRFTAGAFNGTVLLTQFYNLEINGAGSTYSLSAPITVNSNLVLNVGTLNVAAPANTITIHRNFDSSVGGTFTHGNGEVILDPTFALTAQVLGNNTFYNFTCTTPGATILFGAGNTIAIDVGGTFRMIGLPPAPPPYDPINNIWLDSTVPGIRWWINIPAGAFINMQYVCVDWSEALIPIVVPPNVFATANCINWLSFLLVTASTTQDNNPLNGKIDRILVTCATNINNNFSNFMVRLDEDYQVSEYAAGPLSNQFYINLVERDYLDTDATPQWYIVTNTSLRDSATGTRLVALSDPVGGQDPTDAAPPLFGYTLAVADKNEVFIHFSEPVYKAGGGIVDTTDFTIPGKTTTAVTRITSVGNGTKEALFSLNANVSANEIITPILLTVDPTVRDQIPGQVLVSNTHRVSDVGLGLFGNGLLEPLWARDETLQDPERGGIGLIKSFDGTGWLRDQNITVQAHIHNDIAALPPPTSLFFDVDVPSTYRYGGVWLPDATGVYGLVPGSNPQARGVAQSAAIGRLRNFIIPGEDAEIKDGALVEFYFGFDTAPTDLFCGRLTNASAADWYRTVRPWSFAIHDVRLQRGDVSILNNVIDPTRGETVKLHYILSKSGYVTITVFDLKGDIVDILYRGKKDAGDYTTAWDGKNRGGRIVARGVYFIKVVAPGINEIRKVLVVK